MDEPKTQKLILFDANQRRTVQTARAQAEAQYTQVLGVVASCMGVTGTVTVDPQLTGLLVDDV